MDTPMGKSIYTVVAHTGAGEHVLYNTANAAFALLDDQAFSQFSDGCDPTGALAAAGFLTAATPREELARQQELFQRQRHGHTRFVISIVPTYACNYRCPYCYERDLPAKPAGFMSDKTLDEIAAFIRARYDAHPFQTLEVQWYGGDPSLCLDVVKKGADLFRGICAERGAAYESMMLTNCNRIDAEAAQLIADCGISTLFLTIDGPEEHHNRRRVAADGSNSYERVIQAARYARELGISILATMNVDRMTLPLFRDFAQKLLDEEGIVLAPAKLNDYCGTFGTGAFCPPEFDLYTHEEYARARFELIDKGHMTTADLRAMLLPHTHFCNGQRDDCFVIDLAGDVYKCDGWVGQREHALFNLMSDDAGAQPDVVTHDATTTPACEACALLPICQGSCIWERVCAEGETGSVPCHPLKTTLADYLGEYRRCFDAKADGMTMLAAPLAEDELA
ncbi:MAG: radical SAM protein [Eggerthellaceae bacterium]|jgi:uncharacterized protein